MEGVDLSLPDCISHSPERGENEDNVDIIPLGRPGPQCQEHCGIYTRAQEEDREAAGLFDDKAKPDRGEGITHSIDNEDSAEDVNTISARNKTLKKQFFGFVVNVSLKY